MTPNSRLYRSKSDSVSAGHCGGLGKHLNTDPVVFRILFVLAVILGGSGLLLYIILWIVIPEEPIIPFGTSNFKSEPMTEEKTNTNYSTSNPEQKKQNHNDGNLWGGIILIALGGMFLIDRFVPRIDFGDLWPVILIVVGVILISKAYQQNKN